jgi:hypothetical protein
MKKKSWLFNAGGLVVFSGEEQRSDGGTFKMLLFRIGKEHTTIDLYEALSLMREIEAWINESQENR